MLVTTKKRNGNQKQVAIRRRRQQTGTKIPKEPPTINSKIAGKHTFRYHNTATGANSSSFSFVDIFNLLVVITSTTTISSILSAVRLRKISIWQTGLTTGPGNIKFEPQTNNLSGVGTKPIVLQDTGYNPQEFAKILFKPNKTSTQGMWQNTVSAAQTSANGTYFNIDSNFGDTMDITIDYIIAQSDAILTSTFTTGTLSSPIGSIMSAPFPFQANLSLPFTWTSRQTPLA